MNDRGDISAPEDPSIDEMAARWFARLSSDDCTAEDHRAFDAWLGESTAHSAAYQAYQKLWADLAPPVGEMTPDSAPDRAGPRGFHKFVQSPWARPAIAASLLAVAVVVALPHLGSLLVASEDAGAPGRALETVVGERSIYQLDDGTVLTVDTNSLVSVDYSPDQRLVRLERGRLFASVATDEDRPFIVRARDIEVSAIGTEFEVRLENDRVITTLAEGKIEIAEIAEAGGSEDRVVEVDAPLTRVEALGDVDWRTSAVEETTLAWLDGRLIFDGTPLSDAIAEMNRYASQEIIVAGGRLDDRLISGTFSTGRSVSFAHAAAELHGLRIVQRGDSIYITE